MQKNVIGIDVGGTHLRAGVINSEGKLLDVIREDTPDQPHLVIQALVSIVKRLKDTHEVSGIVGIGWPGPVDRKSGLILQSPNVFGFDHYPIGETLKNQTELNFIVENDGTCAGLAEKRFGSAQTFEHFIVLTFGTGIGGVVFSDGKLLHGQTGSTGEMGHMTLFPQGELCTCGNRGCFERYCSARSLERQTISIYGYEVKARDLVQRWLAGETRAVEIMEMFTDHLSVAVGSLVNIFDPECIVCAGGLFSTGSEGILESVRGKISRRCFQAFQENLVLTTSSLQGNAGVVGAGSLALQET